MLRAALLAFLLLAAPAQAKPGDLDRTFGHGGRIAFPGGVFGYSVASDIALPRDGRPLLLGTTQGVVLTAGAPYASGALVQRLSLAGMPAVLAFLRDPGDADGYLQGRQRLIPLAGGGMLVASSLHALDGHDGVALYRLNADGSRDRAFGIGGAVVLTRPDAALSFAGAGVDASGRIVVAATATTKRTDSIVALRLLGTGAPDPVYGDGDIAAVKAGPAAGALLVQPDGSAYVAGSTLGRTHHPAAAFVYALDAQGRRRAGYAARFALRDESEEYIGGVSALARGPHGTLLVAGTDGRPAKYEEANTFSWVARLRASGALDRGFGTRGHVTLAGGRDDVRIAGMARDRHGRIVLAGARGQYELTQALVMRLTPTGKRDRRFGTGGSVRKQLGSRARTTLIASAATALAIDARERILVAGVAYDDDIENREDVGRGYFAVARLRG